MMRKLRLLAALLTIAALSTPLAAYTIYLKDGSRILARSKYRVEGEKAIIVLQSGTQTFLQFSEVDVERTEKANVQNLGTALVFEDGKFVDRTEVKTETRADETLGGLIDRGEATMRPRGERPEPSTTPSGEPRTPRTLGETLVRSPLRNIELATALKAGFSSRGFPEAAIYEGTEQERAFVELKTDSEASVFRGLQVASAVILEIKENREDLSVLELVLTTQDQQRAGEFALTSELAAEIRDNARELPAFYVRNVRF